MPVIGVIIVVIVALFGMSRGIPSPQATSSQASVVAFDSGTSDNAQSYTTTRSTDTSRNIPQPPSIPTENVLPVVKTISAQNIETSRAKLRGKVDMGSFSDGVAFLVYGYRERSISKFPELYTSFSEIPRAKNDSFLTLRLDSNVRESESYERTVYQLVTDTDYYFRFCVEYTDNADTGTISCGDVKTFLTDERNNSSNFKSEPSASTDKATNIEVDEVLLNGDIRMNDFDEGLVFFVYGEDREQIRTVDTIFDKYKDVDEDDENLQKIRIDRGIKGRQEYTRRITELDKSTEYFFQICVEYDGEKDNLTCGGVRSFTTDNSSRKDKPDTTTDGVTSVTASRAKISGHIDMNDFFDGLVFVVYGTDRALVTNVINKNKMRDVRQNGDRLQRTTLDVDLDGRDSYTRTIDGLLSDAVYSYRICVEYEDEDENGRDESFLKCGGVEDFETDRN